MIILGLMASLAATASTGRLYACGDDQVRELRIADGQASEIWRWSASQAAGLPAAYRDHLLDHIDDCKPVDGNRSILITSSTGGAVLIDRASGRVLFRARVPMAHSAAAMPGGLIAIALSIHADGNRLELYDRQRSETVLQSLPLPSGHGLVWGPGRKRLFALSHDFIQAFRLKRGAHGPRLIETARWTLPGRRDGHDLASITGNGYYVTTDDGVWRFDPDDGSFTSFAPLNPKFRVKAVTGMGDRIAWVQAEESWWAHGFTMMAADGSHPLRLPVSGMHLYKVRWVQ